MTRTNTKAKSGGAVVRLLALCLVAFAAIGASGDNSATTANAAGDSRFRGNDGTGGNDGLSFTAFYRQQQAHLLSSLDAALSQKAEDTLLGFSAMRKAEVNLQTKLGGRKSQLGVNLIGAFADAGHYAAGWQLRAYGGGEDSKGVNAGVFYRQINNGNILYGVNAFADYEDGNYGNFLRYSFGGEIQNTLFAINANYYIPETEGRPLGGGVLAYSRRGFDINFRLNVPKWHFMKMRADYYKFDGKNGRKADVGFRYGVELEMPSFQGLQVGVLYDGGSDKFGGDLTYTHTIGEPPLRHRNSDISTPDLFAAVSREYSQRIATVATVPPPVVSVRITPLLTVTNVMVAMAAVTTRMTTRMDMTSNYSASVHFLSRVTPGAVQGGFVVISTNVKRVLTLPPDDGARPITLNVSRDWRNEPGYTTDANAFRIVQRGNVPAGNINLPHGSNWRYLGGSRQLFVTIVEGSEEFIDLTITPETETPMTMAGAITETPMTMAAITTTTRTTTFITMTIMLTANAAMGDISPSNSRFRGNDEKGGNYAMGGNDEGGDNKTPSIPPPSNMPKMAMSKPPFQYHRHSRD